MTSATSLRMKAVEIIQAHVDGSGIILQMRKFIDLVFKADVHVTIFQHKALYYR